MIRGRNSRRHHRHRPTPLLMYQKAKQSAVAYSHDWWIELCQTSPEACAVLDELLSLLEKSQVEYLTAHELSRFYALVGWMDDLAIASTAEDPEEVWWS